MNSWSVKLTIAYHGANYVGWQIQKNGISVQQKLEEAWNLVTGEQIRITASGRTDSGVHAMQQVCSCRTSTRLDSKTLARALNARSPEDICILQVERARDDFHAIRDAVEKTYHYRIQHGSPLSPFERDRSWYVPQALDLEAMRAAAGELIGRHDFFSFQTTGSERITTERTVRALDLISDECMPYRFLTMQITADGFLYNMARTIAGTLVAIGQGTYSADWIKTVLRSRDRNVAGMTAPARALFLMQVKYPDDHLHADLSRSFQSNKPDEGLA